jgi:hypothetical protein
VILRRGVTWRTWIIAFLTICSVVAFGQSKFVTALDKYKVTGDRTALNQQTADCFDRDCDLRVEVPALLTVLSDTSDPLIADFARGTVCLLAMRRRSDGDLFRAAVPIFERHLPDADGNRKETDKWEGSLVMLEAIFGFPPSPRVLGVMYKMVDYKYDPWAQGLAFEGLANLRPIPSEAKELFRSRMVKTEGKVSGADLLPHLAPGLSDPDILRMFLVTAESKDINEQRRATNALANLNQIPPDAVVVFRRLQLRENLDESVAAKVRAVVDRIDHAPPQDK